MFEKVYSLIEELGEVLQSIINSSDPELLKKKQQIEAIDTTLELLVSCDLQVPDDLTSRKKSLKAEIAWMDDPDLALPLIRDELVELIGKIDGYFIQSENQPIKRNIGENKKIVIKSKSDEKKEKSLKKLYEKERGKKFMEPEWSRRLGYIVNTKWFYKTYRDARDKFVKEASKSTTYENSSKYVQDIVDDCEKHAETYAAMKKRTSMSDIK